MVQITQKNFNADMESYISKRKTSEPVKKEKKQEKAVEDKAEAKEFKEEEKEYYSEKKSLFQRFVDFIAGSDEKEEEKTMKEEEKEEIAEEAKEEKELEEYSEKASEGAKKKTGLFNSIKSWFSVTEEETNEEKKAESSSPIVNDDIKEVLKIQNKWILKLPEKTIKEFKNSEDYKIYRETLKKYNLIKVKEE